MSNFTISVTISDAPAAVFAAILDNRGWWIEAMDGPGSRVGDEFGFNNEGMHRARFRVTEVIPGERIEWLVIENHFGFVSDQTEWVGDRIVFELTPVDGGTTVTFTQHGLVPEQECYDLCTNAWTFFVGESLRQFAEHGAGRPKPATPEPTPASDDVVPA